MKLFLFEVVVGVLLVTIVAAVFFRSRRAWGVLHTIRRVGWVYVIVIVLAAIIRLGKTGARDGMRVLIAPQEFKGSLTAEEAADAMAAGIRDVQPGWELDLLPMSDGGPGFIDAMRRATESDTIAEPVSDPLGREVVAHYLVVRATGDVLLEAAQANGLMLLTIEERDALRADTFGVGELIAAAARHSPRRIVIGVGGSATTDGGAGMAVALGARMTSETGEPLPPGGGALADLARIDWSQPQWLQGTEVIVASDVRNPLIGPNGAAAVYGPQKGATPEKVDQLEAALVRYASVVRRSLGVDVSRIAGGGAAGGLGAGLAAFLNATIVSGFDVVAEATNLADRLAAADLVITGEGSFDSQSIQGKTTGRLIELARAAGKPVMVFAGQVVGESDSPAFALLDLEPDPAAAIANAASLLSQLVRAQVSQITGSVPS